jgi:hypothetical protein
MDSIEYAWPPASTVPTSPTPIRDGSYRDIMNIFPCEMPLLQPLTRNFPTYIYEGGVGGEAGNHTVILYCIISSLLKFDNFNHNYIFYTLSLCIMLVYRRNMEMTQHMALLLDILFF